MNSQLHMFTDGRFHPVTIALLDHNTIRLATPSPVGGPNPVVLIRRSPPYPGSPLPTAPTAAGLVPTDFDGDWYSPDYSTPCESRLAWPTGSRS